MRILKRTNYLSVLKRLKGTPDIKVLTGIRRCGKSEILKQYANEIRQSEEEANIIFIDLNDFSLQSLLKDKNLFDYVTGKYKEGVKNYLFIDEVQMVHNFERVLNGFHSSGKYDIYVTGSNAFLQSSDLATLFTGRTMSLDIYPFSFKEFVDYFDLQSHLQKAFDNYLLMGGMPGSYLYESDQERNRYLKSVETTIFEEDIFLKKGMEEKRRLFDISNYLSESIASEVSPLNISRFLSHGDDKIDVQKVGILLESLIQSFLYFRLDFYDIHEKRLLPHGEKYYMMDPSFRYAQLGHRKIDYGKVLKNFIALELKRNGFEVYAGRMWDKEVDFVVMNDKTKAYIQVSSDISNPQTLAREKRSLLEIRDAYPKVIITRTETPYFLDDGILVLDAANWLYDVESEHKASLFSVESGMEM